MCTVTFIPVQHTVFLTHNRDEKIMRKAAAPPAIYQAGDTRLMFPRDGKAGGSWIGVNANGQAAVLLNGAFHKHEPAPFYRKSRGLIFLDILSAADIHESYQTIDLGEIEPFTLVLWNGKQLSECRWDGEKKHTRPLSPQEAHMWSSSTLYENEVIEARTSWFSNWLAEHPSPAGDDIMRFHLEGGEGDLSNDLRMNRDGILMTLSITGIEMTADRAVMKYIDLKDHNMHQQELQFLKAPVSS
jgi:hypothetical protein